MDLSSRNRLLLGVCAAVFACGIAVSGIGVVQMRKAASRIEDDMALLGRLSILEERLSSVEAAKEALKSLESSVPSDFDAIMRGAGLHEKVTDSRSEVASLGDGWSVLTHEVTFSDIVLTDLEGFVSECSAVRPPWVLTQISLRSSPFESGRARATLTMQALRSKSKQP